MQLRHMKTLQEASPTINKVTALAWSPNNKRLAVVTVDRAVHMYDDNGVRRDKFATKPAEKGVKTYLVRSLAFSPDSTKLAVAQSDNIVFIYKLGLEWGDKKSICNKFPQSNPVTCLAWPRSHPNKVVFGMSDGKVKVGQLKNNKYQTLFNSESYVVSIAPSPDGHGVVTGHIDGSLYLFYFEDASGVPSHRKLCQHSSPPYALGWGESIVAAGTDQRVVFYDLHGDSTKIFDYSMKAKDDAEADVREFTCAAVNPSGETIVLGNYNKFFTYNFSARQSTWNQIGVKSIENLYSVTAATWKPDGSRLTIGNLCGAVDIFDACIKRMNYKGQFEFTYVSPSNVIVKRLSGENAGHRIVLKSHFGCEIVKINVFQARYLVAITPETLLMGDLMTCKLSEVQWHMGGSDSDFAASFFKSHKFSFDNEQVGMVFHAGELTLIEYGRNEILGAVRTEATKPSVISVRINERPPPRSERASHTNSDGEIENKKIAFLLDVHTVRVLDLGSGVGIATVNHDTRIDWLELNERGNMLLFRDKRRQLHLYDVIQQNRSTLLSYCNYVQWVPASDVVVAQNRNNLCVWYNINAPDKVTMYQIRGDVEEIERSGGKTEVIVDEGINTASYMLDEALIGFSTAVEDENFEAAMDTLDGLDLTPETEAMWQQLAELALGEGNLPTAERCYAALGDIAKARYIRQVRKIAEGVSAKSGNPDDGMNHWVVRGKLAQLRGDYIAAERIFVQQGQIDEAIEMYQTLHRWDDAIAVAARANHGDVDQMKADYFDYLKNSGQEERAAQMKEDEGDYVTAINLFLKGGYPARAAQVVKRHNVTSGGQQLLERIASEMTRAGMYEQAGEFYERMDQEQRALDLYLKGNAYRRAVELCRSAFPGKVVSLEARWGDWLVSQKQVDQAINHYIEAGEHEKAIRAALDSAQWSKAATLVEDTLRGEVAKPYFNRIAKHYREKNRFELAEKYYIQAGKPNEAVEMYTKANKWDQAHRVATRYMKENETTMLYINRAHELERQSLFADAEKLYLIVNEPDLAINMYKKARKYEHMIRLVKTHRNELLKETHLHLAQQLEMEGQLRDAENHYCEAGEWQSAVNMYRANDSWDEAIRVAKFHGGVNASKRVAYAWALSIGGEQGSKLLTKLGLVEQAIDYAIESGDFDHAFEHAKNSLKSKLPEVHLKHALYLEDEERFKEAEEEFISAGKPREAIDMYIHQQDWLNATRVAEQYDPSAMPDVLVAQARVAIDRKDYERAESLYVNAKKPELMLKAYQDAEKWQDALRLAKRHLPHKLAEVNANYSNAANGNGGTGPGSGMHNSSSGMQAGTDSASGGGGGRRSGGGHGGSSSASSSSGASGSGSADDVLAAARSWEETGDWSRAIDAYLNVSTDHVSNQNALVEIWQKAVKVCANHRSDRLPQVGKTVAERLLSMSRFESAGDLFKEVEMYREAVSCYISAASWEKARFLCDDYAPHMRNEVESAYRSHMSNKGDASALVEAGQIKQGLAIYAQKGQWDRVFDTCEKHAPESGPHYATIYATQLMEDSNLEEAIHVLGRFGADPAVGHVGMYKSMIKAFLSRTKKEIDSSKAGNDFATLVSELRSMVYSLVQSLKGRADGGSSREGKYGDDDRGSSSGSGKHLPFFERSLLALHYLVMRNRFVELGEKDLEAKTSVALLRFCGIVPPDKAFFEAGMACREAKWDSMAFVFLNHYLDLSEAIEEGDATMIDNSDFVGTDIPAPFDYALPKKQYLEEQAREDVRDWVLQVSMNQEVDQTLETRTCRNCKSDVYEASLTCAQCKFKSPNCLGTGYPIPSKDNMVTCQSCNSGFLKSVWNVCIQQTGACPWCNAKGRPVY